MKTRELSIPDNREPGNWRMVFTLRQLAEVERG